MKKQLIILFASVSAVALTTVGCGPKNESAPAAAPTADAAGSSVGGALQKAVATAEAQTEVVKAKAQEVATNLQAVATTAGVSVQPLIDQARVLIGQSKWAEALDALKKINTSQLPADQQTLVQQLKDLALKGAESGATAKAAGDATKAVGGLLPK